MGWLAAETIGLDPRPRIEISEIKEERRELVLLRRIDGSVVVGGGLL